MTPMEILEELKKLSPSERLGIIEAALHLTRQEMQQGEQPPHWTQEQRQLALAAQTLLPDYADRQIAGA